jgi:hypothetical protein
MLSGDCREWNATMRPASSGRMGRMRTVPPSDSTTSASHSAGYPGGIGTSLVVVTPSLTAIEARARRGRVGDAGAPR